MGSTRWGLNRLRSLAVLAAALLPLAATAQARQAAQVPAQGSPASLGESADDYNRRLQELAKTSSGAAQSSTAGDYRIGPEDLIEISVFEAPDLNRTARVSAGGEISLPLLGAVAARGLTPRELELVLQELLRRSYMKDPHVAVSVREMQSHSVSVFGAVKKPGVFQIRGAKTVVEMLSLAEGLADDAGDTVLVMRHAGVAEEANPTADRSAPVAENGGARQSHNDFTPVDESQGGDTLQINLKNLLGSGDPRYNVLVYPGDVVKVARAGIVYVVGEVRKPGGFTLKTNENISVLQALALAEGLTHTSARNHVQIIRTDEASGARSEVPINVGKILAGKAADPLLHPKDIVFVPNSASRAALYQGAQSALATATGVAIYRIP